jgi:hypothetical protein
MLRPDPGTQTDQKLFPGRLPRRRTEEPVNRAELPFHDHAGIIGPVQDQRWPEEAPATDVRTGSGPLRTPAPRCQRSWPDR